MHRTVKELTSKQTLKYYVTQLSMHICVELRYVFLPRFTNKFGLCPSLRENLCLKSKKTPFKIVNLILALISLEKSVACEYSRHSSLPAAGSDEWRLYSQAKKSKNKRS